MRTNPLGTGEEKAEGAMFGVALDKPAQQACVAEMHWRAIDGWNHWQLFTSHAVCESHLGRFVAGVQAAFFLRGVFPPPAAVALVLAGQGGACAGFAADGDKAPIVK